MSLRDRVHGFLHPSARTHVVTPSGGRGIPAHVASVSGLRRRPTSTASGTLLRNDQAPKRGMWVHYQGRTGILTDLEAGDVATVMLVDDHYGLNVVEIHVPTAQLRQSWFEEIPEGRRPKYEDAAKLGYHKKP